MGSYMDEAIERLKEFEGCVPWMYLDTVGKVTVGVGAMLPDAKTASLLPFRAGERAASVEEIVAEFGRVSGLSKGRVAGFYRRSGSLVVGQDTIDLKLREVLEGFEGYLREHVRGYEGLPDGAKLGLLDMVYNLGPGKLFREYPRLIAAVERGDWAGAAKASLRHGPSPARNAWTKEQFLTAAKRVALQAEAAIESGLSRWVPVLLGAGAGLMALVLATGGVRRRGQDGPRQAPAD